MSKNILIAYLWLVTVVLSFLLGYTFSNWSKTNDTQVIVVYAQSVKPEVIKKEIPKITTPKPEVKKVISKPPEVKSKTVPAKPKVDNNAYLLAQIIHAEANDEPYKGKIAVGNVVMNRVKNPKFPDTIKEVIFQRGQFQPVTNGSIYNKPSSEALKAADEVLNGRNIVGNQALFFYNPKTSTSDWIFSRKTIMDIGNHRFAY